MTETSSTARRADRRARPEADRVASVLIALTLLLYVGSSLFVGRPLVNLLPALPFYAAGYLILRRVGSHPIGWPQPSGDNLCLPAAFAYALVPVAFALPIQRYRLYEIDHIISCTVSYAGVALVIATVYAVPVIALPASLGESNDLVTAGSTLAAAAAFNPVRRRIRRAVDHRFDRARYDAHRGRCVHHPPRGDGGPRHAGARDLGAVVEGTLAPTHNALWLREMR